MKSIYKFILQKNILTVAFLISIFISGCGVKKKASGPEDIIWVVSDSLEYDSFHSDLNSVFGKIIYTPQPERLFKLKRKSVNKLGKVEKKKNVIIFAPLNSGSYTSQYLNKILSADVKKLIEKDSLFVINKYDLWARNQLVMILTAKNEESLRKNLIKNKDRLLKYFQKISNKRMYASLYNPRYERKKIEARILKDNGWLIYVQADFQLSMNKPEENFVWLRRSPGTDMERWIFVHWIDNASPSLLNPDSIVAIRNRVTKKFYRTSPDNAFVEIQDEYLTFTETNFKGRYAYMTQGLWRFSDQTGGGPFISYAFYDEVTGRLYMIDGSIYAPKYLKKALIQQVDVLLQSFATKSELDKDRIADLMEELED